MIDSILIATDGSDESRPAVEYAIDLGDSLDAEVHVLYVVETKANYILTVGLDDQDLEEYREFGRETVTEVADELEARGIPGRGVVKTGKVAPEVVEYAESQGIDQIVVGRQGHGAVEKYLGSTAEKVVRMSNVPVTVVESDGI